MTERTSMTPLKALASISSFLSPIPGATRMPRNCQTPLSAACVLPHAKR
jgi:hypothetical protein